MKGLDEMAKPKKVAAKAKEFAFEKGDFVVYPDGGLLLTLTGATDDGAFDVEWSTIVGSKPGAP